MEHAEFSLASGSPDNLVKQLSVIYPCRKGQMDEASRVALRKVILGLFTPSYGRFSFTKSSGEPVNHGEVSVVRRGMRVLVDKDGAVTRRLTGATARPAPAAHPPTDRECLNVINDFWYHALWASKKLRRGELMMAKEACDGHMKGLLLQMAAWQAGAMHGWAYETWHRGRFLEEWADPRVLAGLHASYASYAAADIARALRATMRLFSWVARETVAALGCHYPNDAEERIVTLVATVLDADTVS